MGTVHLRGELLLCTRIVCGRDGTLYFTYGPMHHRRALAHRSDVPPLLLCAGDVDDAASLVQPRVHQAAWRINEPARDSQSTPEGMRVRAARSPFLFRAWGTSSDPLISFACCVESACIARLLWPRYLTALER